ncbi:hypothetical protein CTB96_16825 [Cryobacterium arcticum]|uniref:HTH OST-type domain-containing protein n=2 Tax=Cryobacterium arcticum TaxID=670052 RepID=A0A317ZP58_9MICO|nr:hypothetical protein CTB96_16825 [Cryobacterium arcticum]
MACLRLRSHPLSRVQSSSESGPSRFNLLSTFRRDGRDTPSKEEHRMAEQSALAAACHEFADYDSLPGVVSAAQLAESPTESTDAPVPTPSVHAVATPHVATPAQDASSPAARKAATALLVRAMDLLAKNDQDWQHASTLKQQMKRMDPSFQERTLGFRQFSDFLKSRHAAIEIDQKSPSSPILLRLRN